MISHLYQSNCILYSVLSSQKFYSPQASRHRGIIWCGVLLYRNCSGFGWSFVIPSGGWLIIINLALLILFYVFLAGVISSRHSFIIKTIKTQNSLIVHIYIQTYHIFILFYIRNCVILHCTGDY